MLGIRGVGVCKAGTPAVAPSFVVVLSPLTNSTGTVTTNAYINGVA